MDTFARRAFFQFLAASPLYPQPTPIITKPDEAINVFDFERVAPLHPTLVHDFPGGAPRFTQKARGYKATVVNGQINVLDGRHTGNRAGMVLRHAS